MPSASDNTATLVTVGVAISERQASRQSTGEPGRAARRAPVGRVREASHDLPTAPFGQAIPQSLNDSERPEAREHRESPIPCRGVVAVERVAHARFEADTEALWICPQQQSVELFRAHTSAFLAAVRTLAATARRSARRSCSAFSTRLPLAVSR